MKKANNILFIILLVVACLILLTYCNKVKATDVSIITGDIYNGDLTPDNPDYVPPTAPSNINTNVYAPDNFGNNIATNVIENTNIFSSNMTFESFNNNINSNSLYYTKDILANRQYNYYSVFSFLFGNDLYIPEYLQVDVKLSNNFSTVTTTGYVYFDTQFYDDNPNNKFYNAKTYKCDNVVLDNPTSYKYAFLVVDMPFYSTFDDFSNNMYKKAFYIDEIIYNGYDIELVYETDLFVTHLFDICYPKSNYITPPNNTTFLSVINNIGAYAYQYNLSNIDYMVFSQLDFNGEKLISYTDKYDYIFDPIQGEFLYTSYQNLSGTFNIDYIVFMNYNYYLDFISYEYVDIEYLFDLFNTFTYDFKALAGMPYLNYNLTTSYNFFNIGYSINGVSKAGGILPYYSSFNFFTLMPSGATEGFGNISYDSVNAAKYYIEPQDWKDFGAHFNNIVVWVCFEMPLLSIITKPLYMFLNGFLEIWTNIAIPLAASMGVIGGALIFYLIYLFISKIVFNKEPD